MSSNSLKELCNKLKPYLQKKTPRMRAPISVETQVASFLCITWVTKNDIEKQLRAFFQLSQCCLTFSWIELEMLLRCCLMYTTIFMLRHILYVVYLWPYLGLGQFMSFLCYLFFIFSLISSIINHITWLKQTHLIFVHFLKCLLLFFRWWRKRRKQIIFK